MIDGKSIIMCAKKHIKNVNDEVLFRSVLSRYYYGVMHSAIDKLMSLDSTEYQYLKDRVINPEEPNDKSIHTSTIIAVKGCSSPVAGDMEVLRQLRVISDYLLQQNINTFPLEVKKDGNLLKKFDKLNELEYFLDTLEGHLNHIKLPSKKEFGRLGDNKDLLALRNKFK